MKVKLLLIFILLLAFSVLFVSSKVGGGYQYEIDPDSLTGEYQESESEGVFMGNAVYPRKLAEETNTQNKTANTKDKNLLGVNTGYKRIEVDLTNQRVYAYEGENKVYDFLISSGKWGRTPTGTFKIWGKFRYTKMEGGRKEINTYYYLPNVPYVMFFENEEVPAFRGFSLHGTYWHNNFGHPMSHGCVNMKTEEAAIIYNWSGPALGDKKSIRATEENPGTEIIIYGVAPRE